MDVKCRSEDLCPVLKALTILGGKWRMPILWNLAEEPLRYNELKRRLKGITNIMLTRSLRDLETHGLVLRKEFEVIPPHVEYTLAEEGRKLLPALWVIKDWGNELEERL